MKLLIKLTLMLLLGLACSASGIEQKLFEEVTNADGSIFAYKFKATEESLILMRVIGGEENPLQPVNPFTPKKTKESESALITFFSRYGIEFNQRDHFVFDGENLLIPEITEKEAIRVSLIMKTLLDASTAQQKLNIWKNENQNQTR